MLATCCSRVARELELQQQESQTSGQSALYHDCFVVVMCLDFIHFRQKAKRGSASPCVFVDYLV